MSWLDGLSRNWAELDPEAEDPRLRPVVLPLEPGDAVTRAASLIAALPRWSVVAAAPAAGTLQAARKTRVWRFVDDVHLRFEPAPRGTRMLGRSQSHVGRGDLGQNARNLR